MAEISTYPALNSLKPEPVDPVKKSISRPDAFSKPGTAAKSESKVTRFRPLKVKRTGRTRKKKRDPRDVVFY